MREDEALEIWTVYDHPRDRPDEFVARLFLVRGGPNPITVTDQIMTSRDLNVLRSELMARGLHCLARQPGDDSVIIESWV